VVKGVAAVLGCIAASCINAAAGAGRLDWKMVDNHLHALHKLVPVNALLNG